VVFDAATTAITWARIHEYEARGDDLPPGVALDRAGRPTTDPVAALSGLLLPMGGHRGYGLALMWEILTGILSGSARFGSDLTGPDDHGRPMAVSILLVAIDPALSMPHETFVERVDTLIDRIHASPPTPDSDEVRVPGERGFRLAEERERDGIPLPAAGVANLRRLGRELGVAW
jgi:LDH2 family malate/lactate/ureidoglycolate dehydrogenase